MLGVDDALDDAHWVNVQDPIKQMFLAVTKAIRAQSAGIRDLTRQSEEFVTHERTRGMLEQMGATLCSKEAATQLIYKMETKVDEKDFHRLETKLGHAMALIESQEQRMQQQALYAADLTARLEAASKDLLLLKNPQYEQVFSYIDRQVGNAAADVERKLESKADVRYVDSALPLRLESLYRDMNSTVSDLKGEVGRAATKEELGAVASDKASLSDLRSLSCDLSDRVTRQELHQNINNHVKPLVSALQSLEKAMGVSEAMGRQSSVAYLDKAQTLERMYCEQQELRLTHAVNASASAPASADRVAQMIDDAVRDRRLGEVNQLHLDLSLAQQSEYVLKQMGIMGESLRLELATGVREDMADSLKQVKDMHRVVAQTSQDFIDKTQKTKQAVKELSVNVARALSKKLDIRDFKKIHRDKNNEILNYIQAPGGMGGGRGGSPSRSVLHSSRSLMGEVGGMGGGGFAGYGSDANREFDSLLQGMREGEGGGGTDPDSLGDFVSDEEGMGMGARQGPGTPQRTAKGTPFARGRGGMGNGGGGAGGRSGGKSPSRGDMGSGGMGGEEGASASRLTLQALTRQGERQEQKLQRQEQRLAVLQAEVAALRERNVHSNIHSNIHNQSNGNNYSNGSSPQRLTGVGAGTGAGAGFGAGVGPSGFAAATSAELERLDWRLAIGEVSMALRRELADKCSREELFSEMRAETDRLQEKMASQQRSLDGAARQDAVVAVTESLSSLKQRVAGELTGARFLWTSGHLSEGLVPWELQVQNASPQNILWSKGGPIINVKIPGLYKLTVAVFTTAPAILQVYLNDQPLFSIQPESLNQNQGTGQGNQGTGSSGATPSQKSDKYYLRRLRHVAGEVSCLSLEEHVSLPSDAHLSVRFHCAVPAQGFIALRKM